VGRRGGEARLLGRPVQAGRTNRSYGWDKIKPLTGNRKIMQAHKNLQKYTDGSADTCAHGLYSVVDKPKRSAKRNTDEANARQAYERADKNPFVWRPSVKRLPDKRHTKQAFVWWVPTSDVDRGTGGTLVIVGLV